MSAVPARRPQQQQQRKPRPAQGMHTAPQNGAPGAAPVAAPAPAAGKPTHLSDVRFSEVPGLSEPMIKAIPHEYCTEVQAKTLVPILAGSDVLAQAKTGTGKTLAFLIPTLQSLLTLRTPPPQSKTTILILSPTRELAVQIADAGKMLIKGLGGGEGRCGIQVVVGGTSIGSDLSRFKNERADILVATPGRLVDLLENKDISSRFSQLRCFILDEADRLLDQGFRNELLKIINSLPDRNAVSRQTLLFSATIPASVHQIANIALLPKHEFISTLTAEDLNTHERVDQHFLSCGLEDVMALTVQVLLEEYRKVGAEFKVMCFLPTARAAGLHYDLFQSLRLPTPLPTWEIHSRMSQPKRMKTAEEFKQAKTGVLFSSDVTARGIDVPGVSMVMQVGMPSSGEQYVHRLGRTARAGANGHGILILADFELPFLKTRDMSSLPLKPYPTPFTPAQLATSHALVSAGLATVPDDAKAQAYQAFLGYYNSNTKMLRWTSDQLVEKANDYAVKVLRYGGSGMGWVTPPLLAKTVGKMGLRGVKGLNIVKALPGDEGGGQSGGRGGGGRGGGGGGGAPRGGGGMGGGRGRGAPGGAPSFRAPPQAASVPGSGGVPMASNGFPRGEGAGRGRGGGRGRGAGGGGGFGGGRGGTRGRGGP